MRRLPNQINALPAPFYRRMELSNIQKRMVTESGPSTYLMLPRVHKEGFTNLWLIWKTTGEKRSPRVPNTLQRSPKVFQRKSLGTNLFHTVVLSSAAKQARRNVNLTRIPNFRSLWGDPICNPPGTNVSLNVPVTRTTMGFAFYDPSSSWKIGGQQNKLLRKVTCIFLNCESRLGFTESNYSWISRMFTSILRR